MLSLQAYYAGLRDVYGRPATVHLQPEYPYPQSYTLLLEGENKEFRYEAQLAAVTFVARQDDGRRLVVKFCRR